MFIAKLKTKQTAFTLAEVLITLGIIGIVAALTIPSLISDYKKKQTITALQKMYTQFNQALLLVANENDTPDNLSTLFGADPTVFGDALASHYKLIKNCKMAKYQGCFPMFDISIYGDANSGTAWDNVDGFYKFKTTDNMTFAISSYGNNCTHDDSFTPSPPTKTCALLYVDINGYQKPNCFGRDVFQFLITSYKTPRLYPYGGFYQGDYGVSTGGIRSWNYQNMNYCSKDQPDGSKCAGRIIDKGWVIDY